MTDRVLLTGISGYLGGHVALAALRAGYQVRGSVRHLDKADAVRHMLAEAGADTSRLDFVALDLLRDDGWDAAMAGCRYLLHTASPFVVRAPKDRMELIRPAVEGTERALRAALAGDVERIVLTSSIAAIAYGHGTRTKTFTASDWTNLASPGVPAYQQSKTLAELRAWDIMEAAGRRQDLAVINPGVILGPLLSDDPGTSAALLIRLLDGKLPALPRVQMSIVDVRDVAAAHVAALTAPQAGGRRHPLTERTLSFAEVAEILRRNFPDRRIPKHQLPDWLVRLYGLIDHDVGAALSELGQKKIFDSDAAISLLGKSPITAEQSIVETAQSLIDRDLV